jgi:hypothetical protein
MQTTIKRAPALICQVILVLIGSATLAFLLWEPHLEGRNALATLAASSTALGSARAARRLQAALGLPAASRG